MILVSPRDTCPPVFTAPFSTVASIWKHFKYLPSDEYKDNMAQIRHEVLFSLKKGNPADVTTWMNAEDTQVSEISQIQGNTA